MRIQETFSANLKRYRKEADLTQEELAEKSGLHRTYVGGIEQRRVNLSLKNIDRLSQALCIDPALLFVNMVDNEDADSSGAPSFAPGGYALCSWDEDGITLRPIDMYQENITIYILSTLVLEGYTGKELADKYRQVQAEIISALRASRPF